VGPGPGCTYNENLINIGFRTLDSPARRKSLYRMSYPSSCVQCFLDYPESNSNRNHYKSLAMNDIRLVLLIIYGMTSLLLRLCMNERLQSALFQELAFSHFTRTVLLTGGEAVRPGRGRLRDECTHNKHPHNKVGTVNRQ
jgi:hypothetical protein